jgi:hypothetical protein
MAEGGRGTFTTRFLVFVLGLKIRSKTGEDQLKHSRRQGKSAESRVFGLSGCDTRTAANRRLQTTLGRFSNPRLAWADGVPRI